MKILLIILFSMTQFGCQRAIGCYRCHSLPIKIDAVNKYEIEAVDDMNEAFGVNLFDISEDGIKIVYMTPSALAQKFDKSSEYDIDGHAQVECENGVINHAEIFISSLYFDKKGSRNLIAHELFHTTGFLGHSKDPDSLMYESVKKNYDIDFSSLITIDLREWLIDTYDLQYPPTFDFYFASEDHE